MECASNISQNWPNSTGQVWHFKPQLRPFRFVGLRLCWEVFAKQWLTCFSTTFLHDWWVTCISEFGLIPSPFILNTPKKKPWFLSREFPHSIETIKMGCLIIGGWDYYASFYTTIFLMVELCWIATLQLIIPSPVHTKHPLNGPNYVEIPY